MTSFVAVKPSLAFLLPFVRGLDSNMTMLENAWGNQALTPYRFCHFIAMFFRPLTKEITEPPPEPDPSEVVLWEKRMYTIHSKLHASRDANVESFENFDHLLYCILGIFSKIDEDRKRKKVLFTDFRAFVLNVSIGGKNGVDTNEVKPITLSRTPACRELYHMNCMELLEEKELLVASVTSTFDNPAGIRVLSSTTLRLKSELTLGMGHGNVASLCLVPVGSQHQKTKLELLFVGTTDGVVRVYDFQKLTIMKAEVSTTFPQNILKYLSRLKSVIMCSTKGEIALISIPAADHYSNSLEIERHFDVKLTAKVHTEAITGFETDLFHENFFTCSLDRTIAHIQAKTFTVLRRMQGHQLGILAMTLNYHYNSIVSCGHESALFVWPLETFTGDPILMTDASHPYTRAVVAVKTVPSKPMVVSMDKKGLFKVWDIRVLRCLCTVACEPDMTRVELENLFWPTFVLDTRSIDIVTAANRKLYVFEYDVDDKALGPYCAHEGPICGAFFDSRNRSILSAAKMELQAWDASSLHSINRIRDIVTSRITAIEFIEAMGCLICGTENGTINYISTASFGILGQWLHQSGQQITKICALPNKDGVCAIGITGHVELVFFDPTDGRLRGVHLTRKDLPIHGTAAAPLLIPSHRRYPNILLIGEWDNSITCWHRKTDTEYIELTKACNFPSDRAVQAIEPIVSLHSFISVDELGWFNMWAVSDEFTWPLARWPSRKPPELRFLPKVTSMKVATDLLLLYAGDDFGIISVYDLSYALGKKHTQHCEKPLTFADVPSVSAARRHRVPPCIVAWEGHPEAIVTVIEIVPSPMAVITGGSDCRLEVWTMGGNSLGMCLIKKLGEVADDQSGIDFSSAEGCHDHNVCDKERHNDLPAPYGSGMKLSEDQLLVLAQRIVDEHKLDEVGSQTDDSVADLMSVAGQTQHVPRRRTMRPFWKYVPPEAVKPLKVPILERPSTLILPSNEILYSVPQYIGIDKVDDASRPTQCAYAPQTNVDYATYGSGDQFRALYMTAVAEAAKNAKRLQKVKEQLAESELSPSLKAPEKQNVMMSDSFGVGNKEQLKQRSALHSWIQGMKEECQRKAEIEKQERIANMVKEHTRNDFLPPLPKATTPPPSTTVAPNLVEMKRKYARSPSVPLLGKRQPTSITRSLPEGMMIPQVRPLAGNASHVKSHAPKPF